MQNPFPLSYLRSISFLNSRVQKSLFSLLCSSCCSLIASFLYGSSTKTLPLHQILNSSAAASSQAAALPSSRGTGFMIPSPKESGKIEMYSLAFYAACTAGGILSCGLTHMAVTPLDLVNCNMQIDPAKYKSISFGFGVLLKEQGVKGLSSAWKSPLRGLAFSFIDPLR